MQRCRHIIDPSAFAFCVPIAFCGVIIAAIDSPDDLLSPDERPLCRKCERDSVPSGENPA